MASKFPMYNKTFAGLSKRIQKTYGTDDPETMEGMRTMMNTLYRGAKDGHVDWTPIERLIDGKKTLLEMWAEWSRQGKIKNLSDVGRLDFRTEAYKWLDTYKPLTDASRDNYRDKFNQLLKWKNGIAKSSTKTGKKAPLPANLKSFPVGDLAKVLEKYQETCLKADTGPKFSKTKIAVLSFVKSEYGDEHPLYRAISKIKTFSSGEKTKGQGWPVSDVIDVMSRMKPAHAAQFWTMCLCGITLKPYKFGLTVDGASIIIRDSKQDHKDGRRNRIVPMIEPPAPLVVQQKSFTKALKDASDGRYLPSDARKCYEVWLQETPIHKERREQYMGHKPQTMGAHYGKVQHHAFLTADAEKIRDYIEKERRVVKKNPNVSSLFGYEE